MSAEQNNNVVVQPVDNAKIKQILKVALILFVVTIIEFIVAFTMQESPLRTSFFVIMTLVKAFYIISEFMHLGHEVKAMIWTVAVPVIFIIWLIIALLMEGESIYVMRFF
ncbi:MAG: cytochrome C oxidase subunit IV family protein [Cyclobacteriaceae bacterium]|nr:cytochrome C oxidase subunit IV family protein [Cyclobacteriaceae bacterium]